jgi:tetratricopeptide (TPR) repeat protein
VNCGLILAGQNKTDEAAKHWEKAKGIEPGHPIAPFNLGLVHAKKRDFDKAIVEWREAVRRGRLIAGQVDGAERLEIVNETGLSLYYIGIAYEEKGQLGEARDSIQEAVDFWRESKIPGLSGNSAFLRAQARLNALVREERNR